MKKILVTILLIICCACSAYSREIENNLKSTEQEDDASAQITTGIYKIHLGMSVTEISKIYIIEKAEDFTVVLYRKFGFGDPEKKEQFNKELNLEYYKISEDLSENIANIRLKALKGLVYEIAIYYKPEYTKSMSWEIFTHQAIQKYGQPIIINAVLTNNDYIFQWSDGITELIIRKNGQLNKEKMVFSVKDYHVFYTHIPTRDDIQLKLKRFDTAEAAPGIEKPSF